MIIALDYHDTLTAAPELFLLLAKCPEVTVHIVTGSPPSASEKVVDGLRMLGILRHVKDIHYGF